MNTTKRYCVGFKKLVENGIMELYEILLSRVMIEGSGKRKDYKEVG